MQLAYYEHGDYEGDSSHQEHESPYGILVKGKFNLLVLKYRYRIHNYTEKVFCVPLLVVVRDGANDGSSFVQKRQPLKTMTSAIGCNHLLCAAKRIDSA